ncbi:DUF4822 domain-containing protein [Chryseobacterium gwangjuense]|uniref:DUF4822 domain-containing protein n=1 Tax=Chryseobacterium gwangjuense TaxID=1069980 RepID=UPI001E5B99FC|nr:DUF4822 domain-containing protein [Chryseobacterium gwangjuense]MCE3076677.1 DUF4822 domain-containing protein [Chryseobacterium gwangjuense]
MSTLKKLFYVASIFAFVATFVSCSSDNNESEIETPSQVLSSTPWETTGAKDKDGNSVALTDPSVSGFVGYSYFKADGNFAIYGLNDVLRSRGTWSVSADGKTRTITALKPDGTTLFTRVVDILVLNKNEFTYRIHTNPNDSSVFYDIKHSRVSHAEPNLGQLILASTPWETTGAKDKNGSLVALTDPKVSGFVGYSYFRANGAYAIYGLNDVLRSQGTWSISPDGKKRTITALDANGNVIFTRVVDILTLNNTEFIYRIVPDATNNPTEFYDIIHKPVNHLEP